jgi:outer membrane protein
MPYLNVEYGPLFARIDTFGLKALALGYGHLELVGQLRTDGYEAAGLSQRQDALPIGLGTLQITPIGAFGLTALHDLGKSHGTLVQARYLAEIPLGGMTLYPELGAEYQSKSYVNYYEGTTDTEAATLGQSYHPGSALNPYVGLMIETHLFDRWYLNAYLRWTANDEAINRSPLVAHENPTSVLVAAAYRF